MALRRRTTVSGNAQRMTTVLPRLSAVLKEDKIDARGGNLVWLFWLSRAEHSMQRSSKSRTTLMATNLAKSHRYIPTNASPFRLNAEPSLESSGRSRMRREFFQSFLLLGPFPLLLLTSNLFHDSKSNQFHLC